MKINISVSRVGLAEKENQFSQSLSSFMREQWCQQFDERARVFCVSRTAVKKSRALIAGFRLRTGQCKCNELSPFVFNVVSLRLFLSSAPVHSVKSVKVIIQLLPSFSIL